MKPHKYFYFRVRTGMDRIELEDASDVDVVEVVRCCDCKWFQCNTSPNGYTPKGVPEWECLYHQRATDVMDFCSYGEKRAECTK